MLYEEMHRMGHVFKITLAAFAVATVAVSASQPAQAQVQTPGIPAFLPNVSSVPATQTTPIDGEWRIDSIGKRIRIEAGRAYAVDPWLHLFVLQIQPNMVVLSDISRTGSGEYTGRDLPLVGQWNARLMPNGSLSVDVAGVLGPAQYTLSPISLDDQSAFDAERNGGDAPPAPPPPVDGPAPDPVDEPPVPSPTPPDDNDFID